MSPTIYRINKIKISLNENDHNPPHVHVVSPDFIVLIDIRTCEVIKGQARISQLNEVLKWVEENREWLLNEWEKRGGRNA